MFCTSCGVNLPAESKFCSSCGQATSAPGGSPQSPLETGGYPPAIQKLRAEADAGDQDSILQLAAWFRDQGDAEEAGYWFSELARVDLKGRVDFSAIAAAVLSLDPDIQLGKIDDSAPDGILLGETDEDHLVLVKANPNGLPPSEVILRAQRVNDDIRFLRIIGLLDGQPFDQMFMDARYVSLSGYGYECQQFGQSGRFSAGAPLELCTPELAAKIACDLLGETLGYFSGKPQPTGSTLIQTGQEPSIELAMIRQLLDDSGRSDVSIRVNEKVLLISHPVEHLSLFTLISEDEEGDEIKEFLPNLYELPNNMAFHDSGLGLAVDYRDFRLGLQITIPVEHASVEVVSKYLTFLEQAAHMISKNP